MNTTDVLKYDSLTFQQFADRYCGKQQSTPEDLLQQLIIIIRNFDPEGFILLECEVLDSSRIGDYTILPFGGGATYKEIPSGPISPRGLASDMSTVNAVWRVKPVAITEEGDDPVSENDNQGEV